MSSSSRPVALNHDGNHNHGTNGHSSNNSNNNNNSRRCRRRLSREEVVYFFDNSVTALAYAEGHIMRPSRVRALHALVRSLGLDKEMTCAVARPASLTEMSAFHRAAYLECLRQAPCICGDPLEPTALSLQKEFDVPVGTTRGDCPLFPEVWPLVESQAGASLACAEALVKGPAKVAMNWSGGMHHAAAAHASGFCFVNDIVLCIRRLLRRFHRVLYVDLDVHHGDGVESAFDGNERVLTLSLHQYGDGFFPGTGDYGDATTAGTFSVNVPLPARTGDAAYMLSFRTALTACVSTFDPEAVVMQCGADTIAGDLIGRLCVTTVAHTLCVSDVLQLGLPTVLLGGGGYHVFHTAKCWAIHTATVLGRTPAQLPYYVPDSDPYYFEHRKECAPLRPTLHVYLDPDVDRPLTLAESIPYWRHMCRSVWWQMRSLRRLREGFTRAVAAAHTWRRSDEGHERLVQQLLAAAPSSSSSATIVKQEKEGKDGSATTMGERRNLCLPLRRTKKRDRPS